MSRQGLCRRRRRGRGFAGSRRRATTGTATDDGPLLGQGLLLGRVRGLAQFAVDFMLVGVRDELVEQVVGAGEFNNMFGGQEWDEPFLPVVVAAFDFAFGLGGGRSAGPRRRSGGLGRVG